MFDKVLKGIGYWFLASCVYTAFFHPYPGNGFYIDRDSELAKVQAATVQTPIIKGDWVCVQYNSEQTICYLWYNSRLKIWVDDKGKQVENPYP